MREFVFNITVYTTKITFNAIYSMKEEFDKRKKFRLELENTLKSLMIIEGINNIVLRDKNALYYQLSRQYYEENVHCFRAEIKIVVRAEKCIEKEVIQEIKNLMKLLFTLTKFDIALRAVITEESRGEKLPSGQSLIISKNTKYSAILKGMRDFNSTLKFINEE